MLVSRDSFYAVIDSINKIDEISLDCETTGLRDFHGDRLFFVTISTVSQDYSFNFNEYPGEDTKWRLPYSHLLELNTLFPKTIYMANAKFDMRFLDKEGVRFDQHKIWDVLCIDKCLYNKHMSYSLKSVAERYGLEKLDVVDKYIEEHKLFTKTPDGKKKHFEKVPLEKLMIYAEKDSRITWEIGRQQRIKVEKEDDWSVSHGYPSFKTVIEREMNVTKICFDIEKRGLMLDEAHVKRSRDYEHARAIQSASEIEKIAGGTYVDGPKYLREAFLLCGLTPGVTNLGQPSFANDVLKSIEHPLAKHIRDYRDALKRAKTYYENFLYAKDDKGLVHPSIRHTGADSFRFSITDPALQTLNKRNDKGEYRVRDSFKARDGYFLISIDFAAQEYRLTADLSGERSLIEKIIGGVDVHSATAELVGVSREHAKTLNFALLYGAGPKKIALMLGITISEATVLINKYFRGLPKIKTLINDVNSSAKIRGKIYNIAGRKLCFEPFMIKDEKGLNQLVDPSYSATNYLIQSSGAEIMRTAMIELDKFLKPYETRMVLSIHDELLFEMPEKEFDLIPKIRDIMKNSYTPLNGLGMETSVSWGKSWGTMTEGVPIVGKVGDSFQEESS